MFPIIKTPKQMAKCFVFNVTTHNNLKLLFAFYDCITQLILYHK